MAEFFDARERKFWAASPFVAVSHLREMSRVLMTGEIFPNEQIAARRFTNPLPLSERKDAKTDDHATFAGKSPIHLFETIFYYVSRDASQYLKTQSTVA